MGKKSDQLKDILRSNEELPQAYSWDNMSDGILQKVATKDVKRRLWSSRYMNIFLALVSLSLLTYVFLSDSNSDGPTEGEAELQFSSTYAEGRDERTKVQSLTESKNLEIEARNQKSYESTTDLSVITIETIEKETQVTLSNEAKELNSNINDAQSEVQSDVLEQTIQLRESIPTKANLSLTETSLPISEKSNASQALLVNDVAQAISVENRNISEVVNPLGHRTHSLVSNNPEILLIGSEHLISQDKSVAKVLNRPAHTAIVFGLGVNQLSTGLSAVDLNTDLRSISEKGLLGYSANLGLQRQVSPLWSLGLTLSYDKQVTVLDYYDSRYVEVDTTVLVRREINSLTEDTKGVYEERTLSGISWDKVIHHNRYTNVSAALILDRVMASTTRSRLLLGGGLQLSYLVQQTGKGIVLSERDNVLYETTSLDESNLNSFSYGLTGRVSYEQDIDKSFFFRTTIATAIDWTKKKIDTGITSRPWRQRATVAIGYRF